VNSTKKNIFGDYVHGFHQLISMHIVEYPKGSKELEYSLVKKQRTVKEGTKMKDTRY